MTTTPHEQKRMAEIMNAAHEMAQRKFDDPAERLMHELLHAAIALAGEHGRGRRMVALALGISKDTLDTRLCADARGFDGADISRLMFDPAALGKKAHGWLIQQIAIRGDRKILMPVGDEERRPIANEVLDVSDATGYLSMVTNQAMDPDSEGGSRITETEQRKVTAAAGMVMQESGELMTIGGAL